MSTATDTRAPGVIRDSELYTLSEVRARTGMGLHAMRQARRKGLVIRRLGKRAFIFGSDLMAFIKESGRVDTEGD